ncbi:MAG: hypothetical protein ACLU4N_20920 [Butyricimonas faecihominis]
MADTALMMLWSMVLHEENTFTGSVTTVKRGRVAQASSTNLIQALSTLCRD